MSYPLRTLIRCVYDKEHLGTVVVTRGDPMYDENHTLIGHKDRFLQVRRGNVKGKECHEFFETLDDWHKSLGIVYPQNKSLTDLLIDSLLLFLSLLTAFFAVSFAFYLRIWMKS